MQSADQINGYKLSFLPLAMLQTFHPSEYLFSPGPVAHPSIPLRSADRAAPCFSVDIDAVLSWIPPCTERLVDMILNMQQTESLQLARMI